MLRRWVLPFVALLLAGCTDASPTAQPGGQAADGSVDETTSAAGPDADGGAILAQVVDSELRPVDKAQVLLSNIDKAAFTGDDGVARFDGLVPGAYTVLAAKPGFRSLQEKGRVVDVESGGLAEVKLTLDPQVVATKENSYHTTFPFTGFLECTVQVAPLAAQSCARQQLYDDPNGGSQHEWTVDSLLVQTVVMEASWEPSVGLIPTQLDFRAYRTKSCTGTAQCIMSDPMFGVKGASPLYFAAREDPTFNLTKRIGRDAQYPRTLYAETLASCEGPDCHAALVAQQKYDAWITVFYGEPAPEGWSIAPK